MGRPGAGDTEINLLNARGDERITAGGEYLEQIMALAEAQTSAGNPAKAQLLYRQALVVARVCQKDRISEISARIRSAAAAIMIRKRRDTWQAKLAKDSADDTTRNKLIMLELLELDDPPAAAKLLNQDADEYLRTYIPLVAGPIEKLTEANCMQLGKWYEKLYAKSMSIAAKTTAIHRAKTYYSQYLQLHETKDLTRSHALLAIKRLDAQAAKFAPRPATNKTTPRFASSGRGMDLLKLINTKKHAVVGEWEFGKTGLACEYGKRQVMAIPYVTSGGYDMRVTYTMLKGTESSVLIPVGDSGHVSVVIGGWGGKWSGIGMINGSWASRNEARVRSDDGVPPVGLDKRATLDIGVRVKGELCEIMVRLNGKEFTSWSGEWSKLSLHSNWEWPAESRTFALGTTGSNVVWHSARLQRAATPRK